MAGPGTATVQFWYDFPSPYAYLAAMRIEALADAAGVEVIWRPFLLGPVLEQRVEKPSPFQNAEPAQARYRRRDVERLAAEYGLPLTWPSNYPRFSLLASRVAVVAAAESWAAPFSRAVFHANFAQDRDIASAEVVTEILTDLGRDAAALIERAQSPENKAALRAAVEEALGHGIFGAPSLLVGTELFWGNDRLDQALAWAARANRAAT
ncbi:MAG: 2-hydroxychromene-2-carboxylate isomerase [Alphaproteobacteria bacterium]